MATRLLSSWEQTVAEIPMAEREKLAALMIGVPVLDASGKEIGRVCDVSLANGDIVARLDLEASKSDIDPVDFRRLWLNEGE